MPKKLKLFKKNIISKPQIFRTVRGMSDILPKDENWWETIHNVGQIISELHDFHFIETPILEPAGLFEAGVGASTDIVEKQMYVFKTKGGDRVALRPEGTAAVVRSYLEHHLGYYSSPLKVFYYGPMFRYERPQAGRERQFHQWGFEILGDADPVYDGEIILVALDFLKTLKFKNLSLKINTVGCKICRLVYRDKLKSYYQKHRPDLCRDCVDRLDKNPFRLLDCQESSCRLLKVKAPIILDYLCQNCNNHFKTVLELVEDNNILYDPDPYLVRGLDYYNRTVFEIYTSALPDLALAGGGRYDYLSEILSGRALPGVGVALGVERIIQAMRDLELAPIIKRRLKVFFAAVGEQARKASLRFINELRINGVAVAEALGKKSLRAQLKVADKLKVKLSLIVGQKEIYDKCVIIRDMKSGAQETVVLDKLIEEVKKRLK